MTPRERVLVAFDHREPDRVPIWCGASDEFWLKAKTALGLDDEGLKVRLGDDFRRVEGKYVGPQVPLQDPRATSRSVFGMERAGIGAGQALTHPLKGATLADLDAYPWPDPDWTDVSGVRQAALAWEGQYAVLGGEWAPFWHDLIDLVGMEETFYRMQDEPRFVDAVLDRCVSYYVEITRRTFELAGDAIDIFFIGNDFGSQAGPLMGPALFERFLIPHMKRLIDLGHEFGLKVQLHCCGGYAPLIPFLIHAGLDAVHAVQPRCVGMELSTLKRQFGSRLVFNGAIDSQVVLIQGTPDSVREDTRRVLRIMMPGGGYVAGASHDAILEETPVENVLAMCDAAREYGNYA